MRYVIILVAIMMAAWPLFAEAKSSQIPDLMSRKDSQHCIASAVYYESLGESRAGKIAVAQVIMNRVRSGRWKSTPCEVVYQKGQFSWINPKYRTRVYDLNMWQESLKIAQLVIDNKVSDPSKGAFFFHNYRVHPRDMRSKRVTAVLGQHVFMK
jgi:spore germination cell wall hydrolase CwlJ-like protein